MIVVTARSLFWLVTALGAVLFGVGCHADAEVRPAEDEGASLAQVSEALNVECGNPSLTVTPSGSDALLSANASCGAKTAEYRFFVRDPGAATFHQIFAYGGGSHVFTPSVSGQHTFIVHVRGVGSGLLYDAVNTASVAIGPNLCATATLAVTPAGPLLRTGTTAHLTATSTCIGTATPQYRFLAVLHGQTALTELAPWGTKGLSSTAPRFSSGSAGA